jgi:hypothetical protein
MSDEKSKKAGGISKFKQQYGQIGGGTPSKRLDNEESEAQITQSPRSADVQTSETLSIQSVESAAFQNVKSPSVQNAEPLKVQTSETLKGQNINSLAVQGESKHKGRTQKTIYLPPRLARRLDMRALQEGKERSEIVADALELYFRSVPLTQNFEDEE